MPLRPFINQPRLIPRETKSTSFVSPAGGSGTFFLFGFHEAPTVDADLTQASQTAVFGTALVAYSAHAFAVFSGAGTASGGTGAVEIEVSGTSITDMGVRIASDTEILVADNTTTSTDQYVETLKKWIGQVTYTLQNAGGGTQTTFASTFNFGVVKYDDLGNRDFTITDFEVVGIAGANDSGITIQLLRHQTEGWTYDAAAFVAGDGVLADMSADLGTESNLINGQPFSYKRSNLNEFVKGSIDEGFLVLVKTTSNLAIQDMDVHVTVSL